MIDSTLAVVIPTYRRAESLQFLLSDLSRQTLLPGQIVVVDGDPTTGEVKAALSALAPQSPWKLFYLPSNHANAPYQRYLGAAAAQDSRQVIFIDDDIRLQQPDFLDKLMTPFLWTDHKVVGISPQIIFPDRSSQSVANKSFSSRRNQILMKLRKIPPGSLTPSGDRIPPIENENPYSRVEWLRGGVMAYLTEPLLKENYSPDAFAMSESGYGLGVDDTFLSRTVGTHGELYLAWCAQAQHPDAQPSQVVPTKAYQRGLAVAYSRRFLNDHYRYPNSPYLSDRLYLLKTYFGNFILNCFFALVSRKSEKIRYAAGYSRGILRGLLNSPNALKLTPKIDWLQDAEAALSRLQTPHE